MTTENIDLTDFRPLKLEGFEYYLISPDGKIANSKTGRQLKTPKNNVGYPQVCLHGEGKKVMVAQVARLVALTYVENPNPEEFHEIDHLDCNKLNSHYTNLRWCSRRGNLGKKWEENRRKSMQKYWNDEKWIAEWKVKIQSGRAYKKRG